MREGPRSFNRLAQPIKTLAQRFAYLGLIVTAVGLMILGKVDQVLMDGFRANVTDAVAPILDAVSRPVESVTRVVENVRELGRLQTENAKLRESEARLMQWQAAARKLEAENKMLRDLLRFVPEAEPGFITARVIADTGGAFAHSLILNAGARDGVTKGEAAVTGDGLIGRVDSVGVHSARILLITDLNSRIPVLVGPNRTRAIMAGNNTDQPRLIHLPPGETVAPGDRVITSGHGGVFPVGLPIGEVATAGDAGIGVKPLVDRSRLEYVRVLDFGLGGVLGTPDDARARRDARKADGSKGARPRTP